MLSLVALVGVTIVALLHKQGICIVITQSIADLINSHLAAGSSGGAVKWFSSRGSLYELLSAMIIGGLCAWYMSPMMLWGVAYYLDLDSVQSNEFSESAGAFISFALGMAGGSLVSIIDGVAHTVANKLKGKRHDS